MHLRIAQPYSFCIVSCVIIIIIKQLVHSVHCTKILDHRVYKHYNMYVYKKSDKDQIIADYLPFFVGSRLFSDFVFSVC